MNKSIEFNGSQFWHNGAAPRAPYNIPSTISQTSNGSQRSQAPITTATSIVALKFDEGVIIAGDNLGSYGSLARFRDCPRVFKANEHVIIGAGGDYADYQYIKDLIEQKIIEEECMDDEFMIKPKAMHCWLTRILYNRRCKFDPLWVNLVVGGIQDGGPFLATVDKLGTAYEDNVICTGYGAYMALPLLRSELESKPNISEDEARDLVNKSMEVLFYRDARSFPKYQVAVITKDKVDVQDSLEIQQNWNLAHLIH